MTNAKQPDLVNLFGDMQNKATVRRWGKTIMVEVVSEDETRAVVQYGVDPETNVPELMQIDKEKDAYRRLTPQEARDIVEGALKYAARITTKERACEPAKG